MNLVYEWTALPEAMLILKMFAILLAGCALVDVIAIRFARKPLTAVESWSPKGTKLPLVADRYSVHRN